VHSEPLDDFPALPGVLLRRLQAQYSAVVPPAVPLKYHKQSTFSMHIIIVQIFEYNFVVFDEKYNNG